MAFSFTVSFFMVLLLLATFYATSFGHRHRHPHPRPGPPGPCRGHHGRPLPFLRNVSPSERRQYFRIVMGQNVTKQQILSNLDNWASQADVTKQYDNFTSMTAKCAQRFHDAVSGNLTGQALKLFNALWAIRQNDQITRLAECKQIRFALNSTRWNPLLRRLVPVPPPTIAGPPPPGCFRHHGHHHLKFLFGFGPKPREARFGERSMPAGSAGSEEVPAKNNNNELEDQSD